jgi:hypothetical protein
MICDTTLQQLLSEVTSEIDVKMDECSGSHVSRTSAPIDSAKDRAPL